jgi:hypothetical protein
MFILSVDVLLDVVILEIILLVVLVNDGSVVADASVVMAAFWQAKSSCMPYTRTNRDHIKNKIINNPHVQR